MKRKSDDKRLTKEIWIMMAVEKDFQYKIRKAYDQGINKIVETFGLV